MSLFRSTANEETAGATDRPRPSGLLRQGMEALVCLALAVMLFRTFEVEGYMISTGSMAPNLLGFHKRAVCPECGSLFAYGVPYDLPNSTQFADEESTSRSAIASVGSSLTAEPHQFACCPNCGLDAIDLAEIPRNQGDQLLVNKSAYEFRSPGRWDVIVFRNPYRPSQAYVKRAIGLPGESVQIVDGDIYINGHISRKNLEKQRAIRIPVFDNDHVPGAAASWKPRWVPDAHDGIAPWKSDEHSFVLKAAGSSTVDLASQSISWVSYHNWKEQGGSHTTSVAVNGTVANVRIPDPVLCPVKFDARSHALTCFGALSSKRYQELIAANPDPPIRQAIDELNAKSHDAPVTDDYGYNHHDSGAIPIPVRDLMFEATLELKSGRGDFVVEMTDGHRVFDLVLDTSKGEVRLYADGAAKETPVRRGTLLESPVGRSTQIEMSLFDRQVLVAIDGEPAFDPFELVEGKSPRLVAAPRPVRFGARGLDVEVHSVQLYRDVHYTPGKARNGVNTPCELADDEYFVLGDNSPVSADSRNWAKAGVPAHLLLGQPFVVHLPSRPGQVRVGSVAKHIRIPDFARMRYIR